MKSPKWLERVAFTDLTETVLLLSRSVFRCVSARERRKIHRDRTTRRCTRFFVDYVSSEFEYFRS
jgi:hypothetical protein